MSETRYLAVAFASRSANGDLKPAVTEAAPEGAKVVRTRSAVVAAVFEVGEDTDPRIEGERLRGIVAKETQDADLTAAVSGPKRGSTGAHLALLQAEQAATLERGNGGAGRTTHFEDLGAYQYVLGEPESDIARLCSPSSQSEAVVPCSTVPSRLIFPAWNSMASTSEVFPTPRWPTTAMLRIFPGSVAGIRLSSSWAVGLRQS